METIAGAIDICQQTTIVGWALRCGRGARVRIEINDAVAAEIEPSIPRPDVAAHFGVEDEKCGFSFHPGSPLSASDKVEITVCGADFRIETSPHRHRVDTVLFGIDRSSSGIELGGSEKPFLRRPHFDVTYVDYRFQTNFPKKYNARLPEAPDRLDFQVENGGASFPLGKSLAKCLGNRRFDYGVATLCMGRVADPIGWLNQIAAHLVPGARFNITLPEATRTPDRLRSLSSASDMIEAFECGYTQPTFRQVFDHIANGPQPASGLRQSVLNLREALTVARNAAAGQYVDVSCHVWTHDSFVKAWQIVDGLGLCKLRLDKSWPAFGAANEFTISFVEAHAGKRKSRGRATLTFNADEGGP